MIKKFIVIESTETIYQDKIFEIETQIKQNVRIPFSEDEWRCVMFDGIRVQLKNEDNYIIGSLL